MKPDPFDCYIEYEVHHTPNWWLDVNVKKTWSKFAAGEGLNVAALADCTRVRGAAADQEESLRRRDHGAA